MEKREKFSRENLIQPWHSVWTDAELQNKVKSSNKKIQKYDRLDVDKGTYEKDINAKK